MSFQKKIATPLRLIAVGHVDHGKSTLLGRLLYDTHSLFEEQLVALRAACEAEQKEWEPAFVLDAFFEEQAKNITLDITHLPFRTAERDYVLIDAPGHEEFLKKMLTGATTAEAAILLIDITQGHQEQTRRHAQLLALLGIRQIIVTINKMDLVAFSQTSFQQIEILTKNLFREFHLPEPQMIPIAARLGENIILPSAKMPWHQGPTLLAALDHLEQPPTLDQKPLRVVVQDVYPHEEHPLIVGRVESGTLHAGEEIIFWPHGKKMTVRSIEKWNASEQPTKAIAGESIAITLSGKWDTIERGLVGSTEENRPQCSCTVSVRLFWFDETPLSLHQKVLVHLGTQRIVARVAAITQLVDTLTKTTIPSSRTKIHLHEVAEVLLQLEQPLVYDSYDAIPPTGRLAIAVEKRLGGAGIVYS